VIAQGNDIITVVSFFYIIMGLLFVTNGVLRGSGDMAVSMVSTIVNLVVRVAAAYYLSSKPAIGFRGIWWSIPIGWCCAFLSPIFAIAVVNGPKKAWLTLFPAEPPKQRRFCRFLLFGSKICFSSILVNDLFWSGGERWNS